jgi:hypothetical protein
MRGESHYSAFFAQRRSRCTGKSRSLNRCLNSGAKPVDVLPRGRDVFHPLFSAMPLPHFLKFYPTVRKRSKEAEERCALDWRCSFAPDANGVFSPNRDDRWEMQLVSDTNDGPWITVPLHLAPSLWILLLIRLLIRSRRTAPWAEDYNTDVVLSTVVGRVVVALHRVDAAQPLDPDWVHGDLTDIMVPIYYGYPPTPHGVGLMEVHLADEGRTYEWGSGVLSPAMSPSTGELSLNIFFGDILCICRLE